MLRKFLYLIIGVVSVLSFTACSEEAEDVDDVNKQTILVFMPWSGNESNTGLLSYFYNNLDSIKAGIQANKGLSNTRLLVFLSESASSSRLYEITWSKNTGCQETTVQEYTGNSYTTSDGITAIINTVKTEAPALNYAFIMGGHGTGWTKAADWTNYPTDAKSNGMNTATENNLPQFSDTRFMGSVSDKNYAIDVETLAQGITSTSIKFQYMLLDNCYMANVETAYALRNATNFLIASTSEIMNPGMPYYSMWDYLNTTTPSYSSITSKFKTFYSHYAYPYGGLSVIDCRQMDNLASLMKQINANTSLSETMRDSVQILDGFTSPIFYDMTSYVKSMNPARGLLSQYTTLMSTVIRSSVHTDSLYSNLYNQAKYIKINTYSGLTISDPTNNTVALKNLKNTEWWKATNN
jgi:hypothetical protein